MLLTNSSVTSTIVRLSMLAGLLLTGAMLVACHPGNKATPGKSPEQHFEVKGKIVSVDKPGKTVKLSHDSINDAAGKTFMDAMTMSFPIRDEQALEKLVAGDQVQATLVYSETSNLTWLEKVTVTKAAGQ